MALQATRLGQAFDRTRWARIAEGLAVAVAVSLPWSTSAAAILITLWLLAVLPLLDPAAVRREVMTPAGGLPVVFWLLAVIGMLWADVSWAERFAGLQSFHKLLVIPLLLAQFRNSGRGMWVFIGFLASCAVLLAASLFLALWPGLTVRSAKGVAGVPVKDAILQSGEFVLCAIAVLPLALGKFRVRHPGFAAGLLALAALFLANVLFLVPGRTALVVLAVLLVLFCFRQFAWKGALGILLAGATLAAAAWTTSPNLRLRVNAVVDEFHLYQVDNTRTSTGERLEFWRKSIRFVSEAPVIGHGTGTIRDLFRRAAVGESGISSLASSNPHNQILTVAVQLGLIGVAVLSALWFAHLLLFRGESYEAWIGLIVVVQSIVGSLFNSHLFDFTQGWMYVFGVGIAGGMALRTSATQSNNKM
jgi:O-antigen ligase